MELPGSIDTVVVGAGQAGLIMSRLLTAAGREHVVLERRESLGGGWQDRWDSFRLVSPNFLASLPGYPYDGPEPDAFMTRDEMVGRIRAYADVVGAPVVAGTEVRVLSQDGAAGRRLHLETSRGPIDADSVISATGAFHVPRIPKAADGFPASILQLHSHDYRNPDQLPPGGVLIVGSGQTGVQLAEELHKAGRAVVLSTGRCWRIPRRYRGYDCFWWIRQIIDRGAEYDTFFPTVAQLPTPRRSSRATRTCRATTAATTRTCARWGWTAFAWPADLPARTAASHGSSRTLPGTCSSPTSSSTKRSGRSWTDSPSEPGSQRSRTTASGRGTTRRS